MDVWADMVNTWSCVVFGVPLALELKILWFEFGLLVCLIFVIALMFRRVRMTQDDVLAKLATLKTKVEALIAKAGTPVDLTPVGTAVEAISAEVDAANPPAA